MVLTGLKAALNEKMSLIYRLDGFWICMKGKIKKRVLVLLLRLIPKLCFFPKQTQTLK